MGPKLFQVGFNKTATTALFWLFVNSGHTALHSGGRRSRRAGHPVVSRAHPQLTIHGNINAGLKPAASLEDFEAFFDMEYDVADSRVKIENFKYFDRFARAYPNARFMLNIRDKTAWLRSRARHSDGHYVKRTMARMGLSKEAVLQYWGDEFDRHHDAVQNYFVQEKDRLLVFDVDNMPISDVIAFCKPDFNLDAEKWIKARITDEIAVKRSWSGATSPTSSEAPTKKTAVFSG